MSSSTCRRHGVRGCALGLLFAAAASPVPLAAESAVAGGSGTPSASARIDFRIVIPAVLRVADAQDGLLRGSLRSGKGALSVSREDDGVLAALPVRNATGQPGVSRFEARTSPGVYTIASP